MFSAAMMVATVPAIGSISATKPLTLVSGYETSSDEEVKDELTAVYEAYKLHKSHPKVQSYLKSEDKMKRLSIEYHRRFPNEAGESSGG